MFCLISEEQRVPWIGCGVGLALGLLIVVGDEVATENPAIKVWFSSESKKNL